MVLVVNASLMVLYNDSQGHPNLDRQPYRSVTPANSTDHRDNLKESRSGIAVEGKKEDDVVMLGVPDQTFSFEQDINSEVSAKRTHCQC